MLWHKNHLHGGWKILDLGWMILWVSWKILGQSGLIDTGTGEEDTCIEMVDVSSGIGDMFTGLRFKLALITLPGMEVT